MAQMSDDHLIIIIIVLLKLLLRVLLKTSKECTLVAWCAKVQAASTRSLTNVSDLAAQLSDDHLIVMPHPHNVQDCYRGGKKKK